RIEGEAAIRPVRPALDVDQSAQPRGRLVEAPERSVRGGARHEKPPKRDEAAGAASCVEPDRAIRLLHHVALPLAAFLYRRGRRARRGEVELHRVTALDADLVTELEAVDLPHVADHLAILVATAVGRADG